MTAPLNVLIIDDDPLMAKTLSDILSYRGYQTAVAHSGAEALEKARTTPFDCVFSDIRMPGMDGIQLYRALKAVSGDVPTALMTAYAEMESMREGIEAGVAAVFTKPLNLDMLFLFVQSVPDHLDEFAQLAYARAVGSVMTRSDLRHGAGSSGTHR